MNRTIVVPAEMRHAKPVAETMRRADVLELEASGSFSPLEAVEESIALSDPDMVWTCLDKSDGHPIAIFGVAPLVGRDTFWGAAWLLTSDRLEQHRREAWLHSVETVRKFHTRYAALTNWIDERNVVSLRWLERLGFIPTVRREIGGYPFTQYVSLRKCVTPPSP